MIPFLGTAITVVTSVSTILFNIIFLKLPWVGTKHAKVLNFSFLFLTSLVAIGLSRYGKGFLSPPILQAITCGEECFEFYVVFRVMLGAAIYHLIQAVLLVGVETSDDKRSFIQDALWPIKAIVLGLIIWGCFYIPARFFLAIFYVSLTISAIFTLLQAVLTVDLFYSIAEYLVEQYEETERSFYKWALIISTVAFNLSILGGSVFLWTRFTLGFDRFLIIFNVFTAALMTILSASETVQKYNHRSGIFQSSALAAYNFYLITSALLSRPANNQMASGQLSYYIVLAGYFMAVFSTAFSAYRTGQASHKIMMTDSKASFTKGDDPETAKSDKDAAGEEAPVNEEYNRSFFQLIFVMAALNLAIVMTRWRMPVIENGTLNIVDNSLAFWVKVVTSWVIVAMYLWTLFAPVIFDDRDFF